MATWPICLIKSSSVASGTGFGTPAVIGRAPRFDLRELFAVVQHTAELLRRFPQARRIVPGFDVAGDENAVPSWCFALMFREFEDRLSAEQTGEPLTGLSFRVHAGEDFFSPLQGLRRIEEAVTRVIPHQFSPRIGHGLALAHLDPHLAVETLVEQPADEAFDDLVWAWSMIQDQRGPGLGDLTALLAKTIEEAGKDLYGIDGAGAPDYVQAYRRRFDHEALQRLGFVGKSTHHGGLELKQALAPAPREIADLILFVYLTQRRLGRRCERLLIDPIWMTQAIDAVRPLVRAKVRESEAVIEVCPTSNLIIGDIDDYQRHPIHRWLTESIRVTINTDDPGLFSVTLGDEYAHIWASSPLAPAERSKSLEQIRETSVQLMTSCKDAAEVADVIATVREEFRTAGLIGTAER
jgi:hypothetical protein